MASRFPTLIAHDTRLQFRYGIYYAYGFVIAFYIFIFVTIGAYIPGWATAVIIYTDPAAVGFFFLGALMMLEKAEGVRTALAITPVSAAEYYWSKTIPLTALALVAVTLLAMFLHEAANIPMLALIVMLTSVHYLGLGVPIAQYFKTVTSYLIGAGGILLPIIGPGFIALLDDMPVWAIIIPSASQLRLILIATGDRSAEAWELIAMFGVSAIAAALTAWWAINRLQLEFGQK